MARSIDQTLLKPTVGFQQAASWMDSQVSLGFATLCVSPFLVPLAAQKLADSETKVCSVVGFPLGYSAIETKATEAGLLVALGAFEIDMVMNIAAFLEGEHDYVEEDIRAVVGAVDEVSVGRGKVKVILETGYLDDEQIAAASCIVARSGADFVKTSTGFGPRGASLEDVRIMREAVGDSLGVKAAGGIRDAVAAVAMIEAGASRIGSSSGGEILEALEHGRV